MFAVFGALVVGTDTLAYPPPAAAAKPVSAPASCAQGQSCTITFQFVDANGNGITGLTVTFGVHGVTGATVSPTTGTTDPGFVSTTLFPGTAGCGTAVVTATSSTAATQASIAVPCTGGAQPLPGTGASPPGPSPWVFGGLALAILVVLGGGITLRQTRRTA